MSRLPVRRSAERLFPVQARNPRVARGLIEEFRVSLFAQELGTAEKVSVKRLEEAGRAL